MQVTLWGTRGSLATPGPEMARYGGNTSCVGIVGREGTMLVLDAGTGVRRLGAAIPESVRRVDILLTHLHMDHIQGLGFFAPLYRPDMEAHIWGPGSVTLRLQARLMRYLSPPLFPVSLSELPCKLTLHEVPCDDVDIGEFRVTSALVCHPGPTVGYRIAEAGGSVMTYLPDHEPALGSSRFPGLPRAWTSGGALAADADLLIHDGQYSAAEYPGPLRLGPQLACARSGLRNADRGAAPRAVSPRPRPLRHRPRPPAGGGHRRDETCLPGHARNRGHGIRTVGRGRPGQPVSGRHPQRRRTSVRQRTDTTRSSS